ncbi:DNA polymerase V subunit UmuC [compost metagenome]
MLVVDRSIEPRTDIIVVATARGNLTCKRLEAEDGSSILRAENPRYQGIRFEPGEELDVLGVVVRSNNDGCVVSRSNEAKALGIAMGEPYFMLRELITLHGIEVFRSNYPLYGNLSLETRRPKQTEQVVLPLPLSCSDGHLAKAREARCR